MNSLHKRLLTGILIISVTLRVAAAFYVGNVVQPLPGTFDQVSYHNLALRVLGGHGFTFGTPWWPATAANEPTAHWSYLYTGYLILVYALFGSSPLIARLIQAVIVGILQPYLAYRLGKEVFNPLVGLASAALTALYTYFIYYSATLMTEPFYITAILAALWLAIRVVRELRQERAKLGTSLALGAALGAAVLLRQLFLLIVPFVFLWVWWASGRRGIGRIFLSSLAIVVMILPFTIFNYARFNRFVLLNTNAGYAFYWGNHPIYGTHFVPILSPEMGSYQELIPEELLSLDEAALDQELLRRGLRFVLADPLRYLLLSLSRIPPYFMFWPSPDSELLSNIARVTSFGILWPFILAGMVLAFLRRSRPLVSQPVFLLYLFILVYSLIHILTWTLVRYRLPVDAVLVIFAALTLVALVERLPVLHQWIASREWG